LGGEGGADHTVIAVYIVPVFITLKGFEGTVEENNLGEGWEI